MNRAAILNTYRRVSLTLLVLSAGSALGAGAAMPHAGQPSRAKAIWTNEDLERLSSIPGLISVVGQSTEETAQDDTTPAPRSETDDPAWYAAQAASLNAQLAAEQANVRDFIHALEDVRALSATTSGINLDEANIGLTPGATIEILQSRVSETQSELDALEDLARRNDIEPGILRGQ